MDALAAANVGPALAYGADPWTERAAALVGDVLGEPGAQVAFCWGGTGANVVGLQCLLRPWEGGDLPRHRPHQRRRVRGPRALHRRQAAGRCPTPDGKLRPEQIAPLLHVVGDEHHVQPRVVSITQSTESGTLYRPDEIAALAEVAHAHDLYLHLDGARLANAAAALRRRALVHHRGRGRRAHLRRHQGRRHVRRGRGVPAARPRRAGAVRAQAGGPAALEDALRGRPVRGPAHRRPLGALAPTGPTGWRCCWPTASPAGPGSRSCGRPR